MYIAKITKENPLRYFSNRNINIEDAYFFWLVYAETEKNDAQTV